MFNTVNHSVEMPVQEPLNSVAQLLTSDSKGQLITFPIVWTSSKKGNIAVFSGSIYKITDVEGTENDGSKCTVYFIDEHNPKAVNKTGSFRCTLSMDEVVQKLKNI